MRLPPTPRTLAHGVSPMLRMGLVIPGTELLEKDVFLFECPVCKKQFRWDDRYGVACTGPSESRDEHPLEMMRLVGTVPSTVFHPSPQSSESRSK